MVHTLIFNTISKDVTLTYLSESLLLSIIKSYDKRREENWKAVITWRVAEHPCFCPKTSLFRLFLAKFPWLPFLPALPISEASLERSTERHASGACRFQIHAALWSLPSGEETENKQANKGHQDRQMPPMSRLHRHPQKWSAQAFCEKFL